MSTTRLERLTNLLSKGLKSLAEQHPDLDPYPGRFDLIGVKSFLGAVAKQPTPHQAAERAHAYHGDPTR
jgi:hypothetical protein